MHESIHPSLPPSSRTSPTAAPGVYADLLSLVRLEFKARGYSFLPRQPVHSLLSGRYASRLRGRGLNFEELRHYQRGDDIRTMDWKVTARTRKPHVRVYTEERDRAVLLVVDQRIHMFFGSQQAMKSVVAAEATALAAWRALSVGDRVGGIVFNDETVTVLQPHRSRASVMQLLKSVVTMNQALKADSTATANPGQLNEALRRTAQLASHDCLVVVITDFEGADDETTRLTAHIAQHNDMLGVHLVDPLRRSPVPAGRVVVSDGAQQLEMDTDDAELRQQIVDDYQRELADIRTTLRKLSAPLITLSTAEDVAAQIRRAIGAASRSAKPAVPKR